MAKFRSLIYFNGRAGNVVGRKGQNGEYIVSMYQPRSNQPNSVAQLTQRMKLSIVTKTLGHFASWAAIMCKKGRGSGWNTIIRKNLNEAVGGTYPNLTVDADKMTIAVGSVDNPYSPSATLDSNTLNVTWTDNSGLGNAEAGDMACICVYNKDKGQIVYNTSAAERSTRNATLTLPAAWSGDTVEAWFAMRRPKDGDCSNSIYIGSYNL